MYGGVTSAIRTNTYALFGKGATRIDDAYKIRNC